MVLSLCSFNARHRMALAWATARISVPEGGAGEKTARS